MKRARLQPCKGVDYRLPVGRDSFCRAIYLGIIEAPSGLLWEFQALENNAFLRMDRRFRLPYDGRGLEIIA